MFLARARRRVHSIITLRWATHATTWKILVATSHAFLDSYKSRHLLWFGAPFHVGRYKVCVKYLVSGSADGLTFILTSLFLFQILQESVPEMFFMRFLRELRLMKKPVTKCRSLFLSCSSVCAMPEDFTKLFARRCPAYYFQKQSDFFCAHCDTR